MGYRHCRSKFYSSRDNGGDITVGLQANAALSYR
jgi:hypothetical protein